MKDKRPINLEISTIGLPVAALVSILHRVSGVFMLLGVALLLYLLDQSLASPESFAALKIAMASWWCKLIVWVVLVALIYHSVAGIRHLLMDIGIGESLEGGRMGAITVFVATVLLALWAGACLWW